MSLPLSFESSSSAFLFLFNNLCFCQFRWNSYCGPEGVFFCGRTSIHINVSSAFGENLNLTWTSAAFPQRVTGSYHLDRGGTRYGGATACSLSADYKNFLSDCGSSLYSVVGSDPNLLMWKTLGPVLCLLCPLKVMFSFSLFQNLCHKGREWGSKWGLCTYWGLMLCLCRHLCIHADTAHGYIFPCHSYPRSNTVCKLWSKWMERLLRWNWDALWDSHEHPGSCTAIRSLGSLWGTAWVRASNGWRPPTGALPWEWMASALQGWVFSLVLGALGSVPLCEVKCTGPGCSLQLGLRSMLRQLLGQMSLHPEKGIVHEWNWGFWSLFICSSKFSNQPIGLVPYA